MATQIQEQGPGPPDPAQLQQLLAVLRTMLSPLPKPTKQPNLLRCDSRFRFSSQTLFSFCDQMPKPTLSGEGIVFSLSPGNTPPQAGWGCLGSLGVPAACAAQMGVRSSPTPRFPSLSWKQKGSDDGSLPALESSLPLGYINTLISHTEPSQVSPCSSSPSYQRTSVSSRPVLYHS